MCCLQQEKRYLSQICGKCVLADHPLLTSLGRRGRGAVMDALLQADGTRSVRDLARAAGVAAGIASRAVDEFQALGLVDVIRPGRAAQVRINEQSPWVPWLRRSPPPGIASVVAASYDGPGRLVQWSDAGERPDDPHSPVRIAIITDDEEAALDAIGPTLDAVRDAGWPAPELTAWEASLLDPDDPVGARILSGRAL